MNDIQCLLIKFMFANLIQANILLNGYEWYSMFAN